MASCNRHQLRRQNQSFVAEVKIDEVNGGVKLLRNALREQDVKQNVLSHNELRA